ncbi:MAG TPA: outer membrane beta-barrel protein [Steroidobacteraceae bacterium]|nr:outer membrane beta-barrel protein [Steroidobacteraceae bacterium]
MRKAMVLGVLGLAGTLASPAFADEFSGFRLGMNISSDKLESDYTSSSAAGIYTINANRFGYGFNGGWALNKWLAVEGGINSGTEFTSTPFARTLAQQQTLGLASRADFKYGDVTVVGSAWIGSKFAVFGRAGVTGYKVEQRSTLYDLTDPREKTINASDKTGSAPIFGVGVQTVLDHALLRLEYKMTEFDDLTFVDHGLPNVNDDVTVFTLNDSKVSSLTLSIVWVL